MSNFLLYIFVFFNCQFFLYLYYKYMMGKDILILKIGTVVMVVILILILVQYIFITKKNPQDTPHSQTLNTLTQDNEIIHTRIKSEAEKVQQNKDKLVKELTETLREKLLVENFEDAPKCRDMASNIFFLYLTTELLEGKFKPDPIWTNDIFCVYQIKKPVRSLDESIEGETDLDNYYPLGDIILIKDYPAYLEKYQENLEKYNSQTDVKECPTQAGNNIDKLKTSLNEVISNLSENNKIEDIKSELGGVLAKLGEENPEINNLLNTMIEENNKGGNNKGGNNKTGNNKGGNNKTGNNKTGNNKGGNNTEGFEDHVPKGDSHITSYDQPALKGLKLLIKNGRKPVGFELKPVTIIPQSNGENLYVWKPIAPEGYIFLGHMVTIGVTANVPQIDSCHIRAVPRDCLNSISLGNRAVLVSPDIVPPYRILLTGGEIYFQGMINQGVEEPLVSYEMTPNCLNVERDGNDSVVNLMVKVMNLSEDGGAPTNNMPSYEFESNKQQYLDTIRKNMLEHKSLKLNNTLNNPNLEPDVFQEVHRRFTLEATSDNPNSVLLKIKLKRRALAYGELSNSDLVKLIEENQNELLNVKLNINNTVYNLVASEINSEAGDIDTTKLDLDPNLNIDTRLKEELEQLGKLAVRNPNHEINLGNLVNLDMDFPDSISQLNTFNQNHLNPSPSTI